MPTTEDTKMKTKLFIAFAIAALSVAGAKSYDITFDQPAMVGNVKLAAGHYSVKVEGFHHSLQEPGHGQDR